MSAGNQATLRALQPVLSEEGTLVIGSEIPNLLEPGAASTLVVSRDVDIGVEVSHHFAVKKRLCEIEGLNPSPEEPSVWVPDRPELIEVNFVGIDPSIEDASETYVLEDRELPLLVFGPLSHLRPGAPLVVEGIRIPVPRPAGLLVEKLMTDRSAEKGDRDLLVAVGLLITSEEPDLEELSEIYARLRPELRHAVRSNLAILSLMEAHENMPDPGLHRKKIADLLGRLERLEENR